MKTPLAYLPRGPREHVRAQMLHAPGQDPRLAISRHAAGLRVALIEIALDELQALENAIAVVRREARATERTP